MEKTKKAGKAKKKHQHQKPLVIVVFCNLYFGYHCRQGKEGEEKSVRRVGRTWTENFVGGERRSFGQWRQTLAMMNVVSHYV